jgi:hypothetical protein
MNFEDIQFAIPSHNRASTIGRKTLALLDRLHVPPEQVTIFVSTEAMRATYCSALAPTIWMSRVIVGAPLLVGQRKAIALHFPEGAPVVQMDDDINRICRDGMPVERETNITPDEFRALCVQGFEECQRCGAHLWGIYPVGNHMFAKDKLRVGLWYIVGAFWGTINSHDESLLPTHDEKEDYERTLLSYVRFGKVVRIDKWFLETPYFGGTGGLQEAGKEARDARVQEAIARLTAQFPTLCKVTQRKTYVDIALHAPKGAESRRADTASPVAPAAPAEYRRVNSLPPPRPPSIVELRELPVWQRLCYFVAAREQAHQYKVLLGGPPPHSDDPFISRFRFCNMDREKDTVTRWIAEHVRPILQGRPLGDQIAQSFVCRVLNEPATLAQIMPVGDVQIAVEKLRAMHNAGFKLLRGAYLTPVHGRGGHGRDVSGYFLPMMDQIRWAFRGLRDDHPICLSSVAQGLQEIKGIGAFIANQVITDLRYLPPWRDAPDWETFVLCGPGTLRGLNRYYGMPLDTRRPRAVEEVLRLRDCLRGVFAGRGYEINWADPNNTANMLCEWDKWERYLWSEDDAAHKHRIYP